MQETMKSNLSISLTATTIAMVAAVLPLRAAPTPLSPVSTPKIKVIGTSVNDDRNTQGGSLRVKLKLQSPHLSEATSYRATIQAATDNTGRNLLEKNSWGSSTGFTRIKRVDNVDAEFRLLNPARQAVLVKTLMGQVEIYIPGNDPTSIIKIPNLVQHIGKPLISETLKNQGISITVWTREAYDKELKTQKAHSGVLDANEAISEMFGFMLGDQADNRNDVIFQIINPRQLLVRTNFQDEKGAMVKSQSSSSSTGEKQEIRLYHFEKPVPPETGLILNVGTPKSIVTTRFEVKDLALP